MDKENEFSGIFVFYSINNPMIWLIDNPQSKNTLTMKIININSYKTSELTLEKAYEFTV